MRIGSPENPAIAELYGADGGSAVGVRQVRYRRPRRAARSRLATDGPQGRGARDSPAACEPETAARETLYQRGRAAETEGDQPTTGGQSVLEDGVRVSAETSRRLACDASRVVMRHAPDGTIVEVGARTRTVPPALRRALQHRDRGCRFPGCGLRFVEGHHVRRWANGGPTTLSNLALLCRRHHRAVHSERQSIFDSSRYMTLWRWVRIHSSIWASVMKLAGSKRPQETIWASVFFQRL